MGDKKRIAITRPAQRSKAAMEIIDELGGETVIRPTLELKLTNSDSLKHLISEAGNLDWLIITSVTSIESIFKFYPDFLHKLSSKCKIATIGHKTAEVAIDNQLPIDLIPEDYTAEGLLEAFESIDLNNKIVGIPRTYSARTLLPDELEKRGAKVILAESYKSGMPEDVSLIEKLIDEILNEEIDGIIFTSPLTVSNLFEVANEDDWDKIAQKMSDPILTVSIGPITARILENYGVSYVCPEVYTVRDMLELMFEKFNSE